MDRLRRNVWLKIIAINVVGIFLFSNAYAGGVLPYKEDRTRMLPVYEERWRAPNETRELPVVSDLPPAEAGIMEGEYQPLPIPLPQPTGESYTEEELAYIIYQLSLLVHNGCLDDAVGKFLSILEQDPELAIAIINNMKPVTSAYIINELEAAKAAGILNNVDPGVASAILTAVEKQLVTFPTNTLLPVPATPIISSEKLTQILGYMNPYKVADILAICSPRDAALIITNLDTVWAAVILTLMNPKDAALIFSHLDERRIADILTAVPLYTLLPSGPLFSPEHAALILNLLSFLWGDTDKITNIVQCMKPNLAAPIIKVMLNTEGLEKVVAILQPMHVKVVALILAYDKEFDYMGDGLSVDECVAILTAIEDKAYVEGVLNILVDSNPEKARQIMARL